MYLAKIQLPTEHPTARMVLASVFALGGETWVSSVKELMRLPFQFLVLVLVSLSLDLFPMMSSLVHVVMQSGAKFS